MTRQRSPSRQTRAVLERLMDDRARWRHGYELSRLTGIASGTLYPLLMRLADRGYLESRWEDGAVGGRPPRHLYRLSATGQQYAGQAVQSPPVRVVPRPVKGIR